MIHSRACRKTAAKAWNLACEQQTHFRSSLLEGEKATTGNASAVRRLPETGMIGGFLTRISVRTFRPHPVWDPRATTDRSRALFTRFICCRLANQSFVRLLRSLYFARKSSKHTEMGRESASYIRYVLKYAFYGTLVLIKRLLCWKLIESA